MAAKERRAITVRLPEEMHERLQQAAEEGARPMGVVVHDALVKYLGSWRPPSEVIAERQQKRRTRIGMKEPHPFDGKSVDECGWPLQGCVSPVPNSKAVLKPLPAQEILRGMQDLWNEAGLGEYTDKHLEATLKALGPRNVVGADGPKADWEQ